MCSKLRYSPCIGLCSTVYGDDVCRGCKRFSEEVIIWNQLEEPEKIESLKRIDAITQAQMEKYFAVINEDQLYEKIDYFEIWLHPRQPILSKAFTLLLKCKDQLSDLASCGLQLKQPCSLSLNQLIDQIDHAIYEHSLKLFEETL